MNLSEVGLRIKHQRKACHLTQEKLAEMVNVSPHYIYEIEKGLKSMSVFTLVDVSTALHISTDFLLFGNHSPNNEHATIDTLDSMINALSENQRQALTQILKVMLPHLN